MRYVFLLAGVAVLCRPRASTLAFFCLTGFIFQFFIITSFYASDIISSALDVAIAAIILFRFPDPYKAIAPIVSIYTVGFYFFAWFGKLNSGFINPASSAASHFMGEVQAAYPMLPGIDWVRTIAGPAAIVIEGLIVVMLVVRRARPLAIVLGIFFHAVISLVPDILIFGLPMMMLTLYFVFLPDAAFAHLRSLWEKPRQAFVKACPTAWVRYGVIAALMILPVLAGYLYPQRLQPMCFYIWAVLYSSIGGSFIWALWKARGQHAVGQDDGFMPRPAVLLLLTVPLWLNGISPYLGLKGKGCLTPFGSLRVIGPWHNHFLIPPSLAVFRPELVQVIDSNEPAFRKYMEKRFLMTSWEFRIAANEAADDFFVTCVYQGKTITLRKERGILQDHFLFKPVPPLAKKHRRYYPIDTREHAIVGEIH